MKKIMFNDRYGLTKAVLEGRKTMTRRTIPVDETQGGLVPISFWDGRWVGAHGRPLKRQPYKIGEVVAVAQNYTEVFDEFATIVYAQDKPVPDNFKAFGSHSDVTLPRTMPGWNNKMFVRADLMPHQIRITNVRLERLQDISDEDVFREGFRKQSVNNGWGNSAWHWEAMVTYMDYLGRYKDIRSPYPREAFACLIDKISGYGTWDENPWVYVYEFELVK